MSWKVAKAAIDLYFKYLQKCKRQNLNRRATVGFYGGEPLLNFGLIRKCVEYIEANYIQFEPYLTITTNGTMLKKNYLNFIRQHSIDTIISIDGDKESHDQNRIFPDGSGSHDMIMANIRGIPLDGIYSVITYDLKTDLLKAHEFFSNNELPIPIYVNEVSPFNECSYYRQFSINDLNAHLVLLEKLKKYWYDKLIGLNHNRVSVIEIMMMTEILRSLGTANQYIPDKPPFMQYTGACIPGVKLFIDCEGNIHLCEKMNDHFPIGHVYYGLNYETIASLINKYNQIVTKNCSKCSIKHMCGLCYNAFAGRGDIRYNPNICGDHVNNVVNAIENAYSSAEINPDISISINDQFERYKIKGVNI